MSDSKLIIPEAIDFILHRQLVPLAQVMRAGARPKHVPSSLVFWGPDFNVGGHETSGLHREVAKELKAGRSQQHTVGVSLLCQAFCPDTERSSSLHSLEQSEKNLLVFLTSQ